LPDQAIVQASDVESLAIAANLAIGIRQPLTKGMKGWSIETIGVACGC